MNPHLEAVLTTRVTLPFKGERGNGWFFSVRRKRLDGLHDVTEHSEVSDERYSYVLSSGSKS